MDDVGLSMAPLDTCCHQALYLRAESVSTMPDLPTTVMDMFLLIIVMEPTVTQQLYCPESSISRGEKENMDDV